MAQAQAKTELGYPPDSILLVTIASSFKYSAPGQADFLDIVPSPREVSKGDTRCSRAERYGTLASGKRSN